MSRIKTIDLKSRFAHMMPELTSGGRWKWAFAIGLVLFTLIAYFRAATQHGFIGQPPPPKEKTQTYLGGFSPDNRLLTYDFCRGGDCYAGLLDLQTGAVTKIVPPNHEERWSSGRFSPSGNQLAFAVHTKSANYRWAQLGLFDLATKSFTKLTHSQSLKEFPSFSPDGKKLIYAQANHERESGKTRFSEWDIYELNIDSGLEQRLTNYEFFLIGQPFYLPDGKQFIFSGEAPHNFSGKTGRDARVEYEKLYQDNTIFILGPENKELHPIFTNGKFSQSPMISRDGKRILYEARSQDLNNAADQTTYGYTFDLFLFENGQHRRLTNLKYSLRDEAISPDGRFIAYFSDPEENGDIQLWLLDLSNNQLKRFETTADSLFSKATSKMEQKNALD